MSCNDDDICLFSIVYNCVKFPYSHNYIRQILFHTIVSLNIRCQNRNLPFEIMNIQVGNTYTFKFKFHNIKDELKFMGLS